MTLAVLNRVLRQISEFESRSKKKKNKQTESKVQEVYEEVVKVSPAKELEMTDKMSEQLHEIFGKLKKLDSIESTLNNLCSKMAIVEGGISKLKAGIRCTDTKLQQMNEGMEDIR